MADKAVQYFEIAPRFSLSQKSRTSRWLQTITRELSYSIRNLSFIFCSDEYLRQINQQYLNHTYYTDVITFDYRETEEQPLEADIFISVDRVKDNAQQRELPFSVELRRVMVHGILHLAGYRDNTEQEQQKMREMENHFLKLEGWEH